MTNTYTGKPNYLWALLLGMVLLPFWALAQPAPISISGPNPACIGQAQSYTITPTGGLNYQWSVTPLGNTIIGTGSTGTFQWLSTGTATVTVNGLDANNNVVEQGTLSLSIGSQPNPVLATHTWIDCDPLEDPYTRDGPPVYNDTSTCYKVCAYSTVMYFVENNPGSTYTWTAVGDVNLNPIGNTCYVNWGAPGGGSVTVTETNGSCVGSNRMCVTIIEGPVASFYAQPLDPSEREIEICLGGTAVFVDQSTSAPGSPIVSWLWDFGDGNYSSAGPGTIGGSVSHQYLDEGDYTVTLTVTNSCGCTATEIFTVIVHPEPGVTIECPRVMCEGETATYTVFEGEPCDPDSWTVTGGTILSQDPYTITVQWDQIDASGFGYVSYTSCEPCRGVTTFKVPVVLRNGTIEGPSTLCANTQYLYKLPQWPTTLFNWTVTGNAFIQQTDQPNEIAVTTTGPGTFTLYCDYNNTLLNECMGSASFTGTILPPASINGLVDRCVNTTSLYTLTGAATASWALQAPNNAMSYFSGSSWTPPAFTQVGTYRLSITGAFCQAVPLEINVVNYPAPPDGIDGPDVACAGIPVQYTASTAVPGTFFSWSVSSGTVNSAVGNSTFANFSGSPNYTISVVRVTADAAQCASPPISKIVGDPVPAVRTLSGNIEACGSTNQTYSLDYQGGNTYDWTIIPQTLGSVTTGANSHTANILWNNPSTMPGEYGKVVVRTRKCLGYYYDTLDVYVYSIPELTVTALTATDICSGDAVTFQVTGVPALTGGSILWEYGNGNANFVFPGGITASHNYTITGNNNANFTPVVTITNPNGCVSVVSAIGPDVSVKPAPAAYISPEGPIGTCGAFSENLVATVTTGFGSTTLYEWSGPSALPPSCASCDQWTVNTLGAYSVTVTNSNGCTGVSNIVMIVDNCPVTCGPGNEPSSVTVDGTNDGCASVALDGIFTTSFPGAFVRTQWVYPGSSENVVLTNGQNATFSATFPQAGNYDFSYIYYYTNDIGDTCSVSDEKNIKVPYVGDLFHSVACAGGAYQITLKDRSTLTPDQVPLVTRTYYYRPDASPTFTQLLVPGSALEATTPNLTGGTYVIREIIGNGTDPACTTDVVVVLPDVPVAAFTINTPIPACAQDVSVSFTNTSSPNPAALTSFWQFGDGQSNYQTDAARVYENLGLNPVSLTVSNEFGCTSTATQGINIVPNNLNPASLTASPANGCQGSPVNLQYSALVLPTNYAWYDGATILALPNSSNVNVFQPGGYWVKGTNAAGCVSTTQTVAVEMLQVPPAVIVGRNTQCANTNFILTGYTGFVPGMTYEWRRNGAIVGGNNPVLSQNITLQGNYTYTLTIYVPNGSGWCSSLSPDFIVTVNAAPPEPGISFNVLGCNPYYVELNGTNTVPGNYNWSSGGFGQTTWVQSGGPYKLIFTALSGCRSTNTIAVPKDPAEYLWIFPTGCYCESFNLSGNVTGPIIPFNYWSYLENGGTMVDGYGTTVTSPYTFSGGTYNLTLDNGYCSVTSNDMYYNGDYCERIGGRPAGAQTTTSMALGISGMDFMELYPNPATMMARIDYRFPTGSVDQLIRVYDMVGRLVHQQSVNDSGSLQLDLQAYTPGMYQVVMLSGGKVLHNAKLSVVR